MDLIIKKVRIRFFSLPISVQAFFISVLMVVSIFVLGSPYWHVNDDPINAMLSAGVGFTDTPTEFLSIVSFVLAKAINFLTKLSPDLYWYSIVLIGLCFLSLWQMVLIVFQSPGNWLQMSFINLYLAYIYANFFTSLSFTKIAIVLSSTSILSVMHSFENRDAFSRIFRYGSLCLFACASALRFQGALLGLVLFFPKLMHFVFWKKNFKQWISRLLVLCFLFFVPLGGGKLQNIYFKHYNQGDQRPWSILVNLIDNHRNFWSPHILSQLNNQGISTFDLLMINSWFVSEHFPSQNQLEVLEKLTPKSEVSVCSAIEQLWTSFKNSKTLIFGTLFSIAFVFYSKNRLLFLSCLGQIILVFVTLIIFKKLPERVLFPGFVGLFFLAIYLTRDELFKLFTNRLISLMFFVSISYLVVGTASFLIKQSRSTQNTSAILLSELSSLRPKPNQLFVLTPMSLFHLDKLPTIKTNLSIFKDFKLTSFGWIGLTKLPASRLSQIGETDIFSALLNQNVFIVGSADQVDSLVEFMRTNRKIETTKSQVFSGRIIQVWKLFRSS